MRTIVAASVGLAAAMLLAGCGGSRSAATGTPDSTVATTTQSSADRLSASARKALEENHRLSVYVLWHNQLPRWANRSTRGPALAALAAAAKTRRSRGIRVRMLKDRRAVTSLALDPSYMKASATVVDRQRVQPSASDGHPLGQAVKLNERAVYELHRLGRSDQFVVWKVAPSK